MYKSTFDRIGYQIEALQIDCEKQEVYYKTMITTHEVTIGQQSIQLKKAQEVVEDNLNTILRLQGERDSLELEVQNLAIDFHILEVTGENPDTSSSGRGMVEYPFNPEGEKEPYPYTHPIRDIGTSGSIKEKKK